MKKMLFVLILFSSASCYCQTQVEMNAAEMQNYQAADSILNSVYKKILKKYADDPVFIKNLRASQRIWITFRDAELKTKYPHPEEYGSAGAMCASMYLASITYDRISKLTEWLEGAEEGNICSGSVRTRQ